MSRRREIAEIITDLWPHRMSYVAAEQIENRFCNVKSLAEMQQEIYWNNVEKGWIGPDAPPVSFGDAIALLHTEVSEAMEAYRKWGVEDATAQHHVATDEHPLPKPEGVGSEFADVFIRLLDDCARYGVDLEAEYERKMAYNRTRSFRHGNKKI